jgi:hypothetical protein
MATDDDKLETEDETEDEEDTGDEEEETEDEEENEAAIEPAILGAQARYAEEAKKRKRKPRQMRGPRADLGKKPNALWTSGEACDIWGDMCGDTHPRCLAKEGLDPYAMEIEVARSDRGTDAYVLGVFDGSAVAGSEGMSPGAQLYNYIAETFHMTLTDGPGRYRIKFSRKQGNVQKGIGYLSLPPKSELVRLRMAKADHERRKRMADEHDYTTNYGPYPPGPTGGRGDVSVRGWPAGVGVGPHTPQYPPPGYSAGGSDPEAAQLRAELQRALEREQYNKGVLDEFRAAQREGRAPNVAPPPPASAAPETLEERVARAAGTAVVAALGALGIGPKTAQAVGGAVASSPAGVGSGPAAAPQAPVAVQMFEKLQKATFEMVEGVMMASIKQTAENVTKGVRSATGAPEETVDEAVAVPIEPPKEDEKLPWQATRVSDQNWFGKPAYFARDKETGAMSVEGVWWNNEGLRDKVGEWANTLVENAADYLKSKAKGVPGAAELEGGPSQQAPSAPMPNGSFPDES